MKTRERARAAKTHRAYNETRAVGKPSGKSIWRRRGTRESERPRIRRGWGRPRGFYVLLTTFSTLPAFLSHSAHSLRLILFLLLRSLPSSSPVFFTTYLPAPHTYISHSICLPFLFSSFTLNFSKPRPTLCTIETRDKSYLVQVNVELRLQASSGRRDWYNCHRLL